jgi:error-prone DNA polymerase
MASPGERLRDFRDLFGDRAYLFAELHLGDNDRATLRRRLELALTTGLPLVAANDVHYHVPSRRYLHDVLTATRHGCTVADLGYRAFPNAERHLKSPADMAALFAGHPDLLARTIEIADRCRFSLEELRYEYPEELAPLGTTPVEYLHRLTWEGARHRYPQGIPDKVTRLVEYELRLIEELRYEAYFLTVWDLVRFARSRDILCQGRGSAANSAVCYCLGVTSVDPYRIDVLFERFVSKDRDEAPDIDIDFEHERREEVLQYLYDKYGRERAALTATLITYRVRSAVRDVGKALGLSLDRVDTLAKSFHWVLDGKSETTDVRLKEVGLDPRSRIARMLKTLVLELLGFPRHLSQHVGGMVMTRGPLCELVPIENAAMADRTVIEWDKYDLDDLGILKVDCLCLGILSAIRRCLRLLHGPAAPINDLFAAIPAEDPGVYEMVQRADTVGVFQIESRAQMSMLPRLKPAKFYDLVIEVAIVRPGPIQGDMVHPYLRRRCGEEPVSYPNDEIRAVLEKTLGVPIFQEQAMRLAVVAAGFTPGEADQLRRAMGAWRKTGIIEQFQQRLVHGMLGKGYSRQFAEQVFNQLRGFGEYGFPESHSASFALLVYVSAWLKRYHPAAFCAALINSQPMGFYAPAQLVADAKSHGVEMRPVDVNASDWDCTLEGAAVRFGFRMVSGLSQSIADRIVAERRERGPFQTFEQFALRTRVSNAELERLADADAFGRLTACRRESYWESLPSREAAALFEQSDAVSGREPVSLPLMSQHEEVLNDYRTTGLSLKGHPMTQLRAYLRTKQVLPCRDLATHEADRKVQVAGLVLLRQRPGTASGITFMTLEDETGQANLIIHANTWERFHRTAARSSVLLVRGMLQREQGVIHVVVDKLDDLSAHITTLISHSRDFR